MSAIAGVANGSGLAIIVMQVLTQGQCSSLTRMQHMHHLLPQDELEGSSELSEIRRTVHSLHCKVYMTWAKIKKTAPQRHLHIQYNKLLTKTADKKNELQWYLDL